MNPRQHRRWFQYLVVADYYLAAILLLIASVLKLWTDTEVSELLLALWELDIISFPVLFFLERRLPLFELILACVALVGWQAEKVAWTMAGLYLLFIGAIALASQGYLLLPIDCGCFGDGSDGSPALLLIIRNLLVAVPLLFFRKGYGEWTMYGWLQRK